MSNTTSKVRYNTAVIRRLLAEALTDQDLNDLCEDHFPAVYDQFAQGMNRQQKNQSLIEYCRKHNKFSCLLDQIKLINSEKYAEYESALIVGSLYVVDIPRSEGTRGITSFGERISLDRFKQELSDLINRIARLRGRLHFVFNSFEQNIMPSDCDTAKRRLTRGYDPIRSFANFLAQSDHLPLKVVPIRFGLMNALKDFDDQKMAVDKSITQFCDDCAGAFDQPIEQRKQIRLQLENLLQLRKVVLDEAEKLLSSIDE